MDETLRGQFLIAGARLRDPNFFKTAVLIIEHSDEGAMGLVINRPSSVSVANALAGHFGDLPLEDELVFVGGPVEPAALFVVHDSDEYGGGEDPVVPGVYVGNDAQIFEEVVRAAGCPSQKVQFRVFCGCAGWGPGQLEGELARGDWFVHPASAKAVFEPNPYNVWEALLEKVHESHRLLPHACRDPEWN